MTAEPSAQQPELDEEGQQLETRLLTGIEYTGKNAEQRAAAAAEREDLEQRLAALMVRRFTRQHVCERLGGGPCTHPDHARDVHYMSTMLDVLGLSQEYPQVGDEERAGYNHVVAQEIPHHGGRTSRPQTPGWSGGKSNLAF
jgi:hypothetical protein